MAALVELNSDLSKLTKTAIKKEIRNKVEFKYNITKFTPVLQGQFYCRTRILEANATL